MTKFENEHRVAVGGQKGMRSSVWKFASHKGNVYIMTRMFGADAKVSLHESGQAQWSATSSWVLRDPIRKNSDRHIKRWTLPTATKDNAELVFEVQIPRSELRRIDEVEDLKNIQWLPLPPVGLSVCLECYITPVLEKNEYTFKFPYPLLTIMPLNKDRFFVVLVNLKPISEGDLDKTRRAIINQVTKVGFKILPAHRATVFFERETGVKGMIEMVLVD